MPFSMAPLLVGAPDCRAVFLDGNTLVVHTADGNETVLVTSDFLKNSFRGRHNIANVLAALAVAGALGIERDVVRQVLREFRGVEHRQEFVATINGVDWVNDSKATNINALRQALEAVPDTAVLIAGGRDKGNDYASITGLVRKKVSLLIALGESQGKIVSAFEGVVAVQAAASLEDAVLRARAVARSGQTVLFSPGCASFDMFKNFEDRGMQFKQCVRQLPQW
jgi:UDP-N-acetylmuramoylalanine--D-glutamate ligase